MLMCERWPVVVMMVVGLLMIFGSLAIDEPAGFWVLIVGVILALIATAILIIRGIRADLEKTEEEEE